MNNSKPLIGHKRGTKVLSTNVTICYKTHLEYGQGHLFLHIASDPHLHIFVIL